MRSDKNIVKNVKQWLVEEKQTQIWLAEQMQIAPSLVSQLFNGERKLQPLHIEKMAQITNKSIAELTSSDKENVGGISYSLRGEISNENGKRALAQLLLDAEHYAQLLSEQVMNKG